MTRKTQTDRTAFLSAMSFSLSSDRHLVNQMTGHRNGIGFCFVFFFYLKEINALKNGCEVGGIVSLRGGSHVCLSQCPCGGSLGSPVPS